MVSDVLLLKHLAEACKFVIDLGKAQRGLGMDQHRLGGEKITETYLFCVSIITLPPKPNAIFIIRRKK